MVATTNPHRGFDYQTTVDGEAVPTRFDRSLARELAGLSSVLTVGWSGTREAISVVTEDLPAVIMATARNASGRHAGFDVDIGESESGDTRVLLTIKR